nr:gamma-glutamyl-gamma-aminobutyrate hydrolase family protein [uncultured Holophaga sp.]
MSSLVLTCRDKESAFRYYVSALRQAGWAGGVELLAPGDPAPDPAPVAGLLLLGGADVHPSEWDPAELVHPKAEPDPDRDALELPLIRRAWALGIPILGICRGVQTLNVALGGSLHQDIPEHFGVEPGLHQRGTPAVPELAHGVELDPDSGLSALLGCTRLEVNSRHHQAVKRLAPGLRAVAWHPGTRDGQGALVEALESEDGTRFALGVQWHPENLVGLDGLPGDAARRLFLAFTRRAAQG